MKPKPGLPQNVRLSDGLGRTRGVELFIGLEAWINLVRGQVSVLVVPGCLASDKDVAVWANLRIVVECSERDDGSLKCVEPLDE